MTFQVVKGQRAGTFVILSFRTIGGQPYAQVKGVRATKPGEFALPLSALRAAV